MNKKTIILSIILVVGVVAISGCITNIGSSESTVEIEGLNFTLPSEHANYPLNEYSGHTAYFFGDNPTNIDVFVDKAQYEDKLSAYNQNLNGGLMENFTNSSTKTIEGNEVKIFSDNNGRTTYFFKVNNKGVVLEYYDTLNVDGDSIVLSFYK